LLEHTLKTLRDTLVPIAAGLILALPAYSQKDATESYAEKRDAKLAEGWIKLADWVTDLDVAREHAATEGKLIFAYFTRSYSP